MQEFYSNGKLLITGEYLVLDGAMALALPTKSGQFLTIEEGTNNTIQWKSIDADGSTWYEDTIAFDDIKSQRQFDDKPETNTLIRILHEASLLNPGVLDRPGGFNVTTKLTFPRQWGLGTSSTLINNIAQWFEVDAFTLLHKSFGGSGYDIACAQTNSPLLYRLEDGRPTVQKVDFAPAFAGNLWFVYLNKKQNSRNAIRAYRESRHNTGNSIAAIDVLTNTIINTDNFEAFAGALQEHENSMSAVLGIEPVKNALFPDFPGTLKSLGAWGGDFILAAANEDPSAYFKSRGYNTIIPYNEMILK
jgi:mevalonate kinase